MSTTTKITEGSPTSAAASINQLSLKYLEEGRAEQGMPPMTDEQVIRVYGYNPRRDV
jgi:hypothetical protein